LRRFIKISMFNIVNNLRLDLQYTIANRLSQVLFIYIFTLINIIKQLIFILLIYKIVSSITDVYSLQLLTGLFLNYIYFCESEM